MLKIHIMCVCKCFSKQSSEESEGAGSLRFIPSPPYRWRPQRYKGGQRHPPGRSRSGCTQSCHVVLLLCPSPFFGDMEAWILSKVNMLSVYWSCTFAVPLHFISTYGYGSKNPLDRPAVIRTSGTRGLRKGAWSRGFQGAKWYDMIWNVYMSLCIDQRSHGKAQRSGIETARPAIVFTLGFNLTLSTLGTGWHEFQISWIVNQQLEARKETKQSQVLRRRYTELVVVWIGSGSVWIRVWIGLGPRPRIGPTFFA